MLVWFAMFVAQLDIFNKIGLNVNMHGLKLPQFPRIWAKCTGSWSKITPMKLDVFIKLYPTPKVRMLLSRSLPQSSKYFTPSYLVFGLNVQVPGLKLPKWNIFLEFGLNVQVSRVK